MPREIERSSAPVWGTASAPRVQKHALLADLRQKTRRGEIGQVGNLRYDVVNGREVVLVDYQRLASPRAQVPYVVAGVTLGMGALYGIGVMLWHSRYIWLAAAGIALVVLIAIRLLSPASHGASCTGLHCPGCGG